MKKLYLYCSMVSLFFIFGISLAEAKPPIKSPFSLVLRGGLSSIFVGDPNTTLGSFNAMFDHFRETNPDIIKGKISKVPSAQLGGEVELQWAVGKFSLGLAVSAPARLHQKSSLTYIIDDYAGIQINEYIYDVEVRTSATPILSLYYSSRLASTLDYFINGGIRHYDASLTFDTETNIQPVIGETVNAERFIISRGSSLGYHVGIGLEYRLSARTAFLVDGQWRLCRIRALRGTELAIAYSNGTELYRAVKEGNLYHLNVEDPYTGFRRDDLIVAAAPPEGGIYFPDDIREAVLDLGGLTCRIGFRISLF